MIVYLLGIIPAAKVASWTEEQPETAATIGIIWPIIVVFYYLPVLVFRWIGFCFRAIEKVVIFLARIKD